jgi:hypothetical protein
MIANPMTSDEPNKKIPHPGRLDRVVRFALFASIAFFCVQILSFGYGRDQGIYALVARSVLEGDMPYRDVFDFKPPGIYLIYGISRAIFGRAWWGIRLLEVGGLVGTIIGMQAIANRLWQRPHVGLLAGALTALVHAQLDFWHTAQPETFGGMLTIAGIWLAVRHDRVRRRDLVLIGIVFGVAGLLKPPLSGGGAVVAGFIAWQRARPLAGAQPRFGAAAPPLLWVLLGGVLPFAICLSWFYARGALVDLYDIFAIYTPHYTALAWKDSTLLGLLYHAFSQWLLNFCSLITVGLLLGLASWRHCYARPGIALICAVIAMQLLGVALQGKFFPYHYAASWPLTSMLAALAWCHYAALAAARGRAYLGALLVFALLVTSLRTATKDLSDSFWARTATRCHIAFLRLQGKHDAAQLAQDKLASVADVNAIHNRALAAEIVSRVAADRPVYIWGFEPVVYDLADRPFSSRYIYNAPQRSAWSAQPTGKILMRDLRAKPPGAIVIAYHDVFPMVTGDAIDSFDSLPKQPELKALIDTQYQKVKRVGDFALFLPRSSSP